MLEAQISLRPHSAGIALSGDVIQLALPKHPWGTVDRKYFLIVEWDDADWEKVLSDRRKEGEPYPVITLPYAIRDENGRLKKRSELRLDINTVPDKAAALDKTVTKPTLTEAEYNLIDEEPAKEESVVGKAFRGITSAFSTAWAWLTRWGK